MHSYSTFIRKLSCVHSEYSIQYIYYSRFKVHERNANRGSVYRPFEVNKYSSGTILCPFFDSTVLGS
jgi:hypothetical protein